MLHTELLQDSNGTFFELLNAKPEDDGTFTVIVKQFGGGYIVADDARLEGGRIHFLFGSKYDSEAAARRSFAAAPKVSVRSQPKKRRKKL